MEEVSSSVHRPSTRSVGFVFLFVIVSVVGFFLWGYVINVGSIVFSGEYPFAVSIANTQRFVCNSVEDCTFDLSVGEYIYVVEKQGYFDTSASVSVSRGKNVDLSVSLRIIPFLRAFKGILQTDVPVADSSWENVVQFNWRGKRAVWSSEKVSGGSDLFLWDASDSFPLVSFDTVVAPRLHLGAESVAVLDSGRLFFVDIQKKRRKRVFDSSAVVSNVAYDASGLLVLVDVSLDGVGVQGVWKGDGFEPFEWREDWNLMAWDKDDSDLLVLSAQPLDGEQRADADFRLFVIDVVSGEIEVLYRFADSGIVPVRLWWEGDLLLLEDSETAVWEIVL
jgi:hypothetical protein